MNERDREWWYRRGLEDARRDKPRIFRWRKGTIIAVGETDWTAEEEYDRGEAYLKGCEHGERM